MPTPVGPCPVPPPPPILVGVVPQCDGTTELHWSDGSVTVRDACPAPPPTPDTPVTLVGAVPQCDGTTTLYWSDGNTSTQAACPAPAPPPPPPPPPPPAPVTLAGSVPQCDGTTTLYWSNGTTTTQAACVPPPAVVYPLASTEAVVGQPYFGVVSFTGTTSATPLHTLPPGLTGTFNPATQQYTISGTPTAPGLIAPVFTLNGPGGTTSPASGGSVPIVNPASGGGGGPVDPMDCPLPTVTQPLTPSVAHATLAYTGTIQVANTTAAGVVTGLPAGLVAGPLVGNTITVTGTPSAASSLSAVSVALTNACGGGLNTTSATVPAGAIETWVAPAAFLNFIQVSGDLGLLPERSAVRFRPDGRVMAAPAGSFFQYTNDGWRTDRPNPGIGALYEVRLTINPPSNTTLDPVLSAPANTWIPLTSDVDFIVSTNPNTPPVGADPCASVFGTFEIRYAPVPSHIAATATTAIAVCQPPDGGS
jgi:hypothetical protein